MKPLSSANLSDVHGGATCPVVNDTGQPIVAQPEQPGRFATPSGPGVVIPPGRTGQVPEGNFSVGGSGNYCAPGSTNGGSFRYSRNGRYNQLTPGK